MTKILTAEQIDEIVANHRQSIAGIIAQIADTWCAKDKQDWPCPTMQLADSHEALRAAILPIFKAVVYELGDPNCPHGNLPAYPCHGWWCDGCWTLLGDTLFPSAMSGSIFSYREAVKREEEANDARAR